MSKVKRILSNQKTRLTSRSLSRELALSLILILILFQGVLLAYVYNRQSSVMKQELEKKADDLAVNLSELLVVPLWDYDDEQTGKIGMSFLAIEDIEEVLIKNSSGKILTQLGYNVNSAPSGEEALAYIQKKPVDLIVLDMIMDPGIDGLETYKRIIELHPGQKAIIASGYSESERVKEAQKLGAGAYVKKPCLMEKLAMAIRL